MSRIIFTLASSFAFALSLSQTADARPLSIASADRDTPVCVGDDCPCVDDGCDDPCVDGGCEPDPCVDGGCDDTPKFDLGFCLELDVNVDQCVVKVADDCEDNCNARAVTPACLAKIGPRPSARALAQCQADYQFLCVSQCEEDGGGFCDDIWIGSDVCIDLGW